MITLSRRGGTIQTVSVGILTLTDLILLFSSFSHKALNREFLFGGALALLLVSGAVSAEAQARGLPRWAWLYSFFSALNVLTLVLVFNIANA